MIRAFLLLLVIFVGLLVFAVYRTPDGLPETSNHPAVKLFGIAPDSLKIVVGVIIGSLSLASERTWGKRDVKPLIVADDAQQIVGRERQ